MLSPKGEFFMKRTVSLLLVLSLALSLAACGSAGETLIAPGAEDGGWTGRGGPFALRKVELSGEALQLTGGGDAAYVLTSDGGFHLLCLEGGETRELAYTAADGSPSRIAGDESGVGSRSATPRARITALSTIRATAPLQTPRWT